MKRRRNETPEEGDQPNQYTLVRIAKGAIIAMLRTSAETRQGDLFLDAESGEWTDDTIDRYGEALDRVIEMLDRRWKRGG